MMWPYIKPSSISFSVFLLERDLPLFIVFILIPMLELITFIKVGASIGIFWTFFWIFFTAVVGVTVVRIQGFTTLLRVRERFNAGEVPAKEMLQGFLLTFAGVLLVVPGFITDSLAVFLLIPWVSKLLAQAMLRHRGVFMSQHMNQQQGFRPAEKDVTDVFIVEKYRVHHQQPGETIEGEYKRED